MGSINLLYLLFLKLEVPMFSVALNENVKFNQLLKFNSKYKKSMWMFCKIVSFKLVL